MALFKKVAVIGTGLIGGSIALGLKKNGFAKTVVGVSRHEKSIALALKNKVIDQGSVSLSVIGGADLLVIATPVKAILSLKDEILKHIGKDCVVTDVGSTKEELVKKLGRAFPGYIGSHPLAGSEKRGVLNARASLFKDSICILTPTKRTCAFSLRSVERLWKALGAKVVKISPKKHDEILSLTSHLPHAVAFSLINSVPQSAFKFSSGGLKDTTRIAASDAVLWRDIFLSNRWNLLKAIASFEISLTELKSALKCADAKSLEKILSRSRRKRESLK